MCDIQNIHSIFEADNAHNNGETENRSLNLMFLEGSACTQEVMDSDRYTRFAAYPYDKGA